MGICLSPWPSSVVINRFCVITRVWTAGKQKQKQSLCLQYWVLNQSLVNGWPSSLQLSYIPAHPPSYVIVLKDFVISGYIYLCLCNMCGYTFQGTHVKVRGDSMRSCLFSHLQFRDLSQAVTLSWFHWHTFLKFEIGSQCPGRPWTCHLPWLNLPRRQ